MRRFLLLFATVFLSVAAFAAEEPTYQCLFGKTYNSGSIQNYTSTWSSTNGDYTWTIVNFNNNQNGWNYIRCGAKGATGSATITSQLLPTAISKVTLEFSKVRNTINSVVLESSVTGDFTDAKTVGNFTTCATAETGTQTTEDLTITAPKENLYYRLTVNYKNSSTTKAGVLDIYSISYYSDGTGGGSETLSFDNSSVELTFGDAFTAPTLKNGESKTLTWDSSNKVVATVDGSGKVEIVGIGTTKITATDASDNTNTASYTIKVNAKPHGLAYETTSYVVNAGESFTAPTLTNPNGLTVIYSSSNTDVATVDANTGDVTLTGVFGTTAITATATNSAEKHCTEGSATYTIRVKNPDANIYTDVLNIEKFGVTDGLTTYADYQYRSDITGILYFGNMAGSNSAIQMRHDTSKDASGIIIKANDCGLILKKVTVVWQSSTQKGRILEVYGSDAPYSALSTTKSEMGTKLGEITKGTSTSYVLSEADSYQYIALQSQTGAMYLSSITLEWEGKVEPKFAADLTIAPDVNESDANVITLSKVDISNGLAFDFTGYSVYLNGTEIGGTDGDLSYLPFLPTGNFTISNGTYTYPIAVKWPITDFSTIKAKVTEAKYFAYCDEEHTVTGYEDGMWYLDAEYTIAPDCEVSNLYCEMTCTLFDPDNELGSTVEKKGNNIVCVNRVGMFMLGDDPTFETDVNGSFNVTLTFPFYVQTALKGMMLPAYTEKITSFEGVETLIDVTALAGQVPQPGDEGGKISGVESVVVDSKCAVEYYNLQGVRVEGALTPGIYIRRTATGTSKVAIR